MVFSTYCVTGHWVFSTYFGTTISTAIRENLFDWLLKHIHIIFFFSSFEILKIIFSVIYGAKTENKT